MSKAAFILAGFKLDINDDDQLYVDYSNLFREFGYEPKVANISWRRKTHSEYLSEFKDFYAQNAAKQNLIIGNSFGAAIAYMAAPDLRPDWLLLASLSPFFKEDIGNYPQKRSLRRFGKQRMADFNSYSAHGIAAQLEGRKTVYFYGEKEQDDVPFLVDRVKDSHQHTPGANLIEIPNAGHRMREPEYIAGVKRWCENTLNT